jgi:hypothetical protein
LNGPRKRSAMDQMKLAWLVTTDGMTRQTEF